MAAGLGIRLYLDENTDVALVAALTPLGYEAIHAYGVGNFRVRDEQHLRYASSQQRTLVSHNFGDFARHHADFLQRGEAHEGIILVPQRSLREVLNRLRKHLDTVAPDQQRNNLLWA